MTDLLTTAQAAALAGITPAAFRKAASTDPVLREAKTMIDGRTPGYPRATVEAWRAATPRRVVRTVVGLMLAALALSACGGSDEPTAGDDQVQTNPGVTSSAPSVADAREIAQDRRAEERAVERENEARAIAGECFSTAHMPTRLDYLRLVEDISSVAISLDAALDRIPDPSDGCDANDAQNLTALRTRAHEVLAAPSS